MRETAKLHIIVFCSYLSVLVSFDSFMQWASLNTDKCVQRAPFQQSGCKEYKTDVTPGANYAEVSHGDEDDS